MDTSLETYSNVTSTARIIEEAELFAVRPGHDEEDHRALPETEVVYNLLDDIFGSIQEVFGESRLEEYSSGILSDIVNAFHRRVADIERKLDTNEFQQRDINDNFDGSEVTTNKLERLTNEGKTLVEARNAFETIRDISGDHFEMIVGNVWMPYNRKSKVNHADRSAAVVQSKDFIKAQKINKTLVHIPKGTPILFSGDNKVKDIDGVCLMLDRFFAKRPDMFLVTTGGTTGGDLIAAKWASSKKVPVVAFGLTTKGKRAPFDRNRAIFKEVKPVFSVIFGEGGIQGNLHELSKENRIKAYNGYELVEDAKK